MTSAEQVLAAYPASTPIASAGVAAAFRASGRVLVVLDDDPTGTQSVADLPVLTRWAVEDFVWAFSLRDGGRIPAAVYVLTNSRSLDPAAAAACNREVVAAALAAASGLGISLDFVSRGDSTLRGHFPLEPDTIAASIVQAGGRPVDGVVIVPAFPDAGRVTIGGSHYLRTADTLTPVAETEFAADATFGFSTSSLPAYIEEKSEGRVAAEDVIVIDLATIRSGAGAVAAELLRATGGVPVVADAVCEDDLRALALGLERARAQGRSFVFRVGPPFVRARIGQEPRPPLDGAEAYGDDRAAHRGRGGLIVVGSHVALTTRQLRRLVIEHPHARVVELDVHRLLAEDEASDYLAAAVDTVVAALRDNDVILHTSRLLVRTSDPAESLRIARVVSSAVVDVVNATLHIRPPRFVIAKGGITSSDVATHGLEIRRAMVRGPLLPGIVSLWEPLEGPATGIPYVVFAGNVGDDESLVQVAQKLSRFFGAAAAIV